MTTLSEAIRQWVDYRARLRDLNLVAPATWTNQSAIAIILARCLPADQPVDALRKSHVELYIGERMKTCSPVTIRGEVNVLRQILNWCVDEQLLLVKPRMPTVAVPNVETALPSDDAFVWVLQNLRPPHSLAMEFMMLTGLSPHELERVQVRDMFDTSGPPQRTYQLSLGIGQRPDFAVKQPSRRRWVPINHRADAIWFEATAGMAPEQPAFPTIEATTKAIQRLRNDEPQYAPTAVPTGAHLVTPKSCRKWFASRVAGGQPEHVLQRLLGHAPGSKVTRRHYIRSTDDQVTSAVEGLKL